MPWTNQEKNILCHYLFGDKITQNRGSKILQELWLNNYPQRSQIYRLVDKFEATEQPQ